MNVILKTLIDITETKARRGDDKFQFNQQANYMTAMQTVGLRVNPIPVSLTNEVGDVSKLGFGTAFKGEHRYWSFKFSYEATSGITIQTLQADYDLVPIIKDLKETATFKNAVFRTLDKKDKNVVFEFIE